MSQSAYALTSCSALPLEGLVQQIDNEYCEKTSNQRRPRRQQQQQHSRTDEIVRIYQSYAEMYPNPLLIRERLERDRLLQEIQEEIREKRSKEELVNSVVVDEAKSKRSILSFLFGFARNASKSNQTEFEDEILREQDYLVYSDFLGDDLLDHDPMCGTQSILDSTCIPPEAHAMARFHMSSPTYPILVRRDPSSPILLLTAFGVIAELVHNTWNVLSTSDRHHWEQQSGCHPNDFCKTRATCLGPDCLAIAWGGSRDVLFYRRGSSSWDAVAFFSPTNAVMDHLRSHTGVFESSDLLRVTDLATLMVENVEGGMAATLVVSRLGGYMELVPLAEQIWRLTQTKTKRRSTDLYSITPDNSSIASLTINEHQDDLLHVEVYRTDVRFDTEWDSDSLNPPAEYLLVASGSKEGEEWLTIWAIATVFHESGTTSYSVHVMYLAKYSLGSTSSVTMFASKEIMDYWRKPRRVERRQPTDDQPSPEGSNLRGTISVAIPVISMRFKLVKDKLLLSVLDWNGSVVILDCTRALLQASQPVSMEQVQSPIDGMVVAAVSHAEARSLKLIDAQWSKNGELVFFTNDYELGVMRVSSNSVGLVVSTPLALPSWITGNGTFIGMQEDLMLLLPRKLTLVVTLVQSSTAATLIIATHKRQWEKTRCIDDLALVSDDVYVILQVVSLFRLEMGVEGLDMASCVRACNLALDKLSRIRVASAVQLPEETTELKAKITRWSNRAGTYSLLCQHFNANENVTSFLARFLHAPLDEFAAELAKKGDIKGLEILCSRHPDELSEHGLSMLENLPVTIDESNVSKLLSCISQDASASWRRSHMKQTQELLGARPLDDEGIKLYCLTLLDKESASAHREPMMHVQQSVGEIVAIAKASSSSLPKSERMIKSRACAVEIFLALVEYLASYGRSIRLLSRDARYLVEKLWQTYECLPESIAPHEHENETLIQLTHRVDTAFRSMIATDILLNWCPQNAFAVLSGDDLCGAGVVSTLCNVFCSEISSLGTFDLKTSRLRDLITDLLLLHTDAFESSLDLRPTMEGLLFEFLLLGEFELFAELLTSELRDCMYLERIEAAVSNFITGLILGDFKLRSSLRFNQIQLAIRCQDVLAPLFPSLEESFEGIRRHLDAAGFIRSVLSPSATNLAPSDLYAMLPFDIIELTLRENPLCILNGSEEWKNEAVAVSRYRNILSSYLLRKDPSASIDLHAMPGKAVLHLAKILGLDSSFAKLLVRNRVAHYACQVSMPWIATAIAIVMLIEKKQNLEENELVMDTIAQVVSVDSFDDQVVKAILCREALKLSPIQNSPSFDLVLDSFGRLEHKVSRFCESSWEVNSSERQENQGNSDFLVFRAVGLLANSAMTMVHDTGPPRIPGSVLSRVYSPRAIDRVYRDTLQAYSADLNKLFQILREKSSQGTSDDELLIVIGRFILFWCISNSVRIIEHSQKGTYEQSDAFENLILGASILLHTRDTMAVSSEIAEIRSIADEQSMVAIERIANFPRPNNLRPDLAIVRKLMELGYTENGARRAAFSTNNESAQAALVWAVAHSQDSSFNTPIIAVKRRIPNIDQSAIVDVKQCIHAIGLRLDDVNRPIVPPTRHSNMNDATIGLLSVGTDSGGYSTTPCNEDQTHSVAFAVSSSGFDFGATSRNGSTISSPLKEMGEETVQVNSEENLSKSHADTIATNKRDQQTVPNPSGVAQIPSNGQGRRVNDAPLASHASIPSTLLDKKHQVSQAMSVSHDSQSRITRNETTSSSPSPLLTKCPPPPPPPPTSRSLILGEFPHPPPPPAPPQPAFSSPALGETPLPRSTPLTKQPGFPEIQNTGTPASAPQNPPPPPPKSLSSLSIGLKKIPPSSSPSPSGNSLSTANKISAARSGAQETPPRPPVAPRSAPPILDRSNLLKTGESVLESSRGISNRFDLEERRRLLSKGRELLQQSRNSPLASQTSPRVPSLSSPSYLSQSSPPMTSMRYPPTKTEHLASPAVESVPPETSRMKADADKVDTDGWDFEDFDD